MTTREEVISALDLLNETQLRMVADYLNFLKSRKEKKSKANNGSPRNDSIFDLGKNPIEVGVSDASENLDNYLYR
jgi:hypothetical protein